MLSLGNVLLDFTELQSIVRRNPSPVYGERSAAVLALLPCMGNSRWLMVQSCWSHESGVAHSH